MIREDKHMTDHSHTENLGQEERWYMRFNYYHRFLHALIIISFLGLVLTGMPLKNVVNKAKGY